MEIRARAESRSWRGQPLTEWLLQGVVVRCVNIAVLFILVLLQLLLIDILFREFACPRTGTHGGTWDSLLCGLSKRIRHIVPLRNTGVTRVNISN